MTDERVGAAEWVAVALLTASAILAALLEVMLLAQFYIGRVIFPIVILAGLALNIVLPAWGFRIVQRGLGAVLPVAGWMLTVLALTMYNRPEGDVFVAGIYFMDAALYGLLLGGSVAGFATIVVVSGNPNRPRRQRISS